GFRDIVMDMIQRGADNVDEIAVIAAMEGDRYLVMDMIRLGADVNTIAEVAAEAEQANILIEAIHAGVTNANEVAYKTAVHSLETFDELVKQGVVDVEQVAIMAAENGNDEVLNHLLNLADKGLIIIGNYNAIAIAAAKRGFRHIVDEMVWRGATDINGIANAAASRGHGRLVEYLLSSRDRRHTP
ncbi:MAG: hypothetical protein QXY37_01355, partial [Metallosphaera sp.]